ncbi:PAX-interacting protein 1, partial [Trifolium medium]|nr:PAX-interacting protein 1 [Trifolium medium]
TLASKSGCFALQGKRVYITPHIKPNKEVVASLVTAVHGQIFADKNDNVLDDLLILSCEEDFAICRHFLKRGAAVYSSELVLNGIVIQKLELE